MTDRLRITRARPGAREERAAPQTGIGVRHPGTRHTLAQNPALVVESPEDEILERLSAPPAPPAALEPERARDALAELARWMAAQGVGQNELARASGIDKGNLSAYLAGRKPLTYDTVERLAAGLAALEKGGGG